MKTVTYEYKAECFYDYLECLFALTLGI